MDEMPSVAIVLYMYQILYNYGAIGKLQERVYLSDIEYIEPHHDKTNKMTVCPAKTQISLGMLKLSELVLSGVAKDPSCLHTDSKDSDQTVRMSRLI